MSEIEKSKRDEYKNETDEEYREKTCNELKRWIFRKIESGQNRI